MSSTTNAQQAQPTDDAQRALELLCAVVRGLADIAKKLDDITILQQQQCDLIRRLLERSGSVI